MPFTYESSRYHTLHTFEYDSLAEAVKSAACDIEGDSAWPIEIKGPDGALLWSESGPLKTRTSLWNLAEQHGVDLSFLDT